jgi:tyrosyl-tRNA synthetase
MMTPLLEGLDGVQKMSKSLGNYIGIDEEPNNMYGKAMSIPDELMIKYLELTTNVPLEEIHELDNGLKEGKVHPRDVKMKLARTLVEMYHGAKAAEAAEQHFKTVFQQRALPSDIPEHDWNGQPSVTIVDLITELGLVPSKGEGRRMVQQGAVKINEQKVEDIHSEIQVESGMIVQVGKRKFAKIKG